MLTTRRALLSVSDKRGLVELGRGLAALGFELVSTGGTARTLADAAIPVVAVSEVTGFPEIMDGRVKTLHPRIHGGILADRSRASHAAALSEHDITPIDLVVVNLYPFRETVAKAGASRQEIVEQIDIGGPCMVRAAAKNHDGVTVVVDPGDYPQVLAALEASDGKVPESLRRQLALKAFRHTQAYDAAIAEWLAGVDAGAPDSDLFPHRRVLDLEREMTPRYGENPHQGAAVYRTVGGPGILGGMRQLQGKELSFNNLLDADAARKMVALVAEPAVAIVKHNNPCGLGRGETLVEAYQRALECDPVSAFGSVVALNRRATEELATAMRKLFVEVVVAPGFDEGAAQRYGRKKNLRLLDAPAYEGGRGRIETRDIDGGFLFQAADAELDDPAVWTCATRRAPTENELAALELAWCAARYVKSNAIVIANRHQTVGIGAGQMSRVDSCRLAVGKAQLELDGTAAGSDAFFPFPDGLEVLADAGVTAVIQPGGSKRDDEVVAAADERDVAMLLTGARHFRH